MIHLKLIFNIDIHPRPLNGDPNSGMYDGNERIRLLQLGISLGVVPFVKFQKAKKTAI
ncbi:MAG: hypothetical protein O6940_03095 [Ignavibacteria bacterium]|nr:hypothetical protein [Ignavibacteria bacterium]